MAYHPLSDLTGNPLVGVVIVIIIIVVTFGIRYYRNRAGSKPNNTLKK